MTETKKLGRGLSALFSDANLDGEASEVVIKNQIVQINIAEVKPNKNQPRFVFDEEKIRELAVSITNYGLIEPLIVNQKEEDFYELIAGERRLRAAKLAGFSTVPCVIKLDAANKVLEMMLIENIQREDLTPIEEAVSYEVIIQRKNLTHETLAIAIGKSRAHVTNLLRVLRLPSAVKAEINAKRISVGHAKMLVGLEESQQKNLVRDIIESGLTVRDIEKKVKLIHQDNRLKKSSLADDAPFPRSSAKENDIYGTPNSEIERQSNEELHLQQIEHTLRETLQTKVIIRPNKHKGGMIEIEYYDDDNLTNIVKSCTNNSF